MPINFLFKITHICWFVSFFLIYLSKTRSDLPRNTELYFKCVPHFPLLCHFVWRNNHHMQQPIPYVLFFLTYRMHVHLCLKDDLYQAPWYCKCEGYYWPPFAGCSPFCFVSLWSVSRLRKPVYRCEDTNEMIFAKEKFCLYTGSFSSIQFCTMQNVLSCNAELFIIFLSCLTLILGYFLSR